MGIRVKLLSRLDLAAGNVADALQAESKVLAERASHGPCSSSIARFPSQAACQDNIRMVMVRTTMIINAQRRIEIPSLSCSTALGINSLPLSLVIKKHERGLD